MLLIQVYMYWKLIKYMIIHQFYKFHVEYMLLFVPLHLVIFLHFFGWPVNFSDNSHYASN